jgi:glycosyltransferase involved in cell wall biosynthesis
LKIIINTSILRFGGAIQGAFSFIKECRHFPENDYHVFVGSGIGKILIKEEFPSNFKFYDFNFGPITLRKVPHIASTLSSLEEMINPDCIITPSGPSYWYSKAPHLMGYNLGLYLYSESPYFKKLSFRNSLRFKLKRQVHFYFFRRDSDAYFVQTDDVNQRVRKALVTEKVYTVSNTHNSFYNNPTAFPEKLPARQSFEWRLLTLTAYYRHKNLEIIPLVIEELKNRGKGKFKFILTIDSENFRRIFNGVCEEHVTNIGPVKPEECPSLYNECDVMFLPTLAECFSASYPEAMVMKKPIITTDLGFARNICQEAALYFKPTDPVSAADAIVRLIENQQLVNKLIINGLSRVKEFDDALERARKILNICQKLAEEGKRWNQGN